MSTTPIDAATVNPFARRTEAPPPAAELEQEDDADQDDADPAAEPAPGQHEKDRKQIEFKMRMAAGREAKRIAKQREAAAPITPDKAVAETERLRQKLTNFIPDTTSLEIWKVIDGQPVWVGDYDARAIQSSKNVRHFIHKNLYKRHRAQVWEVVHINADGKERAPYRLSIDPDAQSQEDPVSARLDAIAKEQNGRPSQMKEAVGALRELKELNQEDGPAPPPATTMVEYLMLRDAMAPKEDPRLAALIEQNRRLEAKLDQIANQPPVQLPPMAPPPDPVAAAVALAQVLMAPMQAQLANQQAQMLAAQAAADKREDRIRDEIKEARKSANTAGTGLEALRDQIKVLKEIEKEQGGGGGGDFAKLASAAAGFFKDLKETKAAEQASQHAAQPAAAPAPAAAAGMAWPAGFDVEAKKIATAGTDVERLEATLNAYQFLIKSGDPFWLRFHSIIVAHAQKGEQAEVREYVSGFLDGIAQFVPDPAHRAAALAAYDAQAAGVIGMLAAS